MNRTCPEKLKLADVAQVIKKGKDTQDNPIVLYILEKAHFIMLCKELIPH